MRTSIELSDGLVERARRLAKQKGVTLRSVVEEALERLLRESDSSAPFRLEAVTFGDGGLAPDLAERDGEWQSIRERIGELIGEVPHQTRVDPSAEAANQAEVDAAREGRRS